MSGDCIVFSLLQLVMLVQIVWQQTELSKQLTKWGTNLMDGSPDKSLPKLVEHTKI